jgi:oligopeptide/dipeptide ABC transporter ATP-binding protein
VSDAPRPAERLLSVRDLTVRFSTEDGSVYAVNGVDLDIDVGETLGLVGESGCGKSVTSLAIMGLLPSPPACVVGGQVVFDGNDLRSLSESDMRKMRGNDIAMIFQDPMTSLNPVLTIEEQIVEVIQAHGGVTSEDARAKAAELLGLVGFPRPLEQLGSFPHQFSGGMRQRVMVAIALSLGPRLLISDEPTTALDVTIQAQVLELLKELTTRTHTAGLLITHDLGVVARMTQRTSVMYAGSVVESAPTGVLFARPLHPYTVGLLHSIPRLDVPVDTLQPIEGAPPDQQAEPVGCAFAPRCAWRVEACWTDVPPLTASDGGPISVPTGPDATHVVACHNPVRPEEVVLARPARDGFQPAPTPEGTS